MKLKAHNLDFVLSRECSWDSWRIVIMAHICWQVRLCGVPGGVLSGEVCRVRVEVVNCGQVPLNSLRLTSSAARRLLLDSVSGPAVSANVTVVMYFIVVVSTPNTE